MYSICTTSPAGNRYALVTERIPGEVFVGERTKAYNGLLSRLERNDTQSAGALGDAIGLKR